MLRLNREAAQAAQLAQVKAATDITGFGLLGHAVEMAGPSRKTWGAVFRIHAAEVPTLPGTLTYLDAGYLTRGRVRNPEHYGDHVRMAPTVTPQQRTLLWESETSGGLLVAVAEENVVTFTAACAERSQPCWEIGEVIEAQPHMRAVEVV